MENNLDSWELSPEEKDFKNKFEKIYSKNNENFEELSDVFSKELPENFKEDPRGFSKEYFGELKNILNQKYNNIFDKDPGLAEGYTLEQHTAMVIDQFAKYYEQFKDKLPYYISEKTFLQMLSIHDIGKVSNEVQDLKKARVEKSIWKQEEEKQTAILVKEILENSTDLGEKKINVILEVIGEGSRKMDELITGKMTPNEMIEYLVEKSEELFVSNPEDLFNIIDVYLMCDAGAYTKSAVEDFKDEIGEEKVDNILEKYEEGEKVQFAGLGVTKWFSEENGKREWKNNDRFGDHRMKDWVDEVRMLLKK